MHYRTRSLAAEYLSAQGVSTTEQGLADKASRGGGPNYVIVNGRALYTEADLNKWIADQASRPVVRRRDKRTQHSAA